MYQLMQYHSLTFMFQHQNEMLPNVFEHKSIKTSRFHAFETRKEEEKKKAQSMRTNYLKLNLSQISIFNMGAKLWNKPPSAFKMKI